MAEDVQKLQDERDYYKRLAQGQLAQNAIEKAFTTARSTALQALLHLPDDERDALEAQLGKPVAQAADEGLRVTWGDGEALQLGGNDTNEDTRTE